LYVKIILNICVFFSYIRLIPNAAVSTYMGTFSDTPENAMDKMYEVNYKGVFFLIKEALPYLK
jgi:NAD(P)-dependent dehydrogenase (short-subunit alcohol dehydrogenase family)